MAKMPFVLAFIPKYRQNQPSMIWNLSLIKQEPPPHPTKNPHVSLTAGMWSRLLWRRWARRWTTTWTPSWSASSSRYTSSSSSIRSETSEIFLPGIRWSHNEIRTLERPLLGHLFPWETHNYDIIQYLLIIIAPARGELFLDEGGGNRPPMIFAPPLRV